MTIDITALTFDERDEFNRKVTAEKAITLLSSEIEVSPMVIDGSWGTGKTEFCTKLIHLIENSDSNFTPVYIDAFKADHADEPLMTILAAILKLLRWMKLRGNGLKIKNFIRQAVFMEKGIY